MRKLMVLFLVLLLILSLAACSGGGKKDTDSPAVDGELHTFTASRFDVFRTFEELEYRYITHFWGDLEFDITVGFISLGQEQIDGQNAEGIRLSVTVNEFNQTETITFWISDDDQVLKAVIYDDQELFGDDADYYVDDFQSQLIAYLLPLSTEIDGAFTNKNGFAQMGYKVESSSTLNKNFGAGNVKVSRYELRKDQWGSDNINWEFEIAKVGSKYMYVYYKMGLNNDYSIIEAIFNKVIPR